MLLTWSVRDSTLDWFKQFDIIIQHDTALEWGILEGNIGLLLLCQECIEFLIDAWPLYSSLGVNYAETFYKYFYILIVIF